MTVFDKMCQACNRCDETTVENCRLVKSCFKEEIKNRVVNNIEKEEYPLCSRCIHHQGCHSSIFGEGWGCNKKVRGDIYDNDWHKEQGEDIVPCSEYVFGIPDDAYVG